MDELKKCTTADCREETWDIVNKEVAYCCGYTKGKLLISIIIVVIICYMAYIYYTTNTIGTGSVILLSLSILSYFILPNIIGSTMRSQWNLYNDRVSHLMNITPNMSVAQARAEISREELQKRTRRAVMQSRY